MPELNSASKAAPNCPEPVSHQWGIANAVVGRERPQDFAPSPHWRLADAKSKVTSPQRGLPSLKRGLTSPQWGIAAGRPKSSSPWQGLASLERGPSSPHCRLADLSHPSRSLERICSFATITHEPKNTRGANTEDHWRATGSWQPLGRRTTAARAVENRHGVNFHPPSLCASATRLLTSLMPQEAVCVLRFSGTRPAG